jgi:hypothetical protein
MGDRIRSGNITVVGRMLRCGRPRAFLEPLIGQKLIIVAQFTWGISPATTAIPARFQNKWGDYALGKQP